jgi:hypothetical protein
MLRPRPTASPDFATSASARSSAASAGDGTPACDAGAVEEQREAIFANGFDA